MRLKSTIVAFLLVFFVGFLLSCSSSISGKRTTAESPAAPEAANVTTTAVVVDNTVKIVIEGTVVPPTEKDLMAAKGAAQRRKTEGESAAYKRRDASTSELFGAHQLEERKDLEAFRASDINGYYTYLEAKSDYSFDKMKKLEQDSVAYRLFKAKDDARSAEYNAAKAKAELQHTIDKLLVEFIFQKESELIEQKYGAKRIGVP